MNNILKQTLVFALAIVFVAGACVGPAYALEERSNINANDSEVSRFINSIENTEIKEKIVDLVDVEYLELKLTDVDPNEDLSNEPEVVYENEKSMLNEIKKMSKLEEDKLDRVVENRISDIVDLAKNNSNIVILPSSYDVLEKYNFSKEVKALGQETQEAFVSSEGKTISQSTGTIVPKASVTGYEKSATGYIKNGSGKKLATYRLTIQWFTNSSKKIYYWDLYNKSAVSQGRAYTHIKHIHKSAKTYQSGKVLSVTRESKFQKRNHVPGLVPPYNYIVINADCFNNGKIDAHASTRASYK